MASQLELDVYSRNPRVQEFLNAVVRAREAGDVAAGGGLISVRRSRGEEVDGGRLRAEVDTLVRRLNAPDLDAAVRKRCPPYKCLPIRWASSSQIQTLARGTG